MQVPTNKSLHNCICLLEIVGLYIQCSTNKSGYLKIFACFRAWLNYDELILILWMVLKGWWRFWWLSKLYPHANFQINFVFITCTPNLAFWSVGAISQPNKSISVGPPYNQSPTLCLEKNSGLNFTPRWTKMLASSFSLHKILNPIKDNREFESIFPFFLSNIEWIKNHLMNNDLARPCACNLYNIPRHKCNSWSMEIDHATCSRK